MQSIDNLIPIKLYAQNCLQKCNEILSRLPNRCAQSCLQQCKEIITRLLGHCTINPALAADLTVVCELYLNGLLFHTVKS